MRLDFSFPPYVGSWSLDTTLMYQLDDSTCGRVKAKDDLKKG